MSGFIIEAVFPPGWQLFLTAEIAEKGRRVRGEKRSRK
jgi:hypothetical protein